MRQVGSPGDFREPDERAVRNPNRGGGFMDPYLRAILTDSRVLRD
jgi:hypothetical protein